jgi:hypothetical protein
VVERRSCRGPRRSSSICSTPSTTTKEGAHEGVGGGSPGLRRRPGGAVKREKRRLS